MKKTLFILLLTTFLIACEKETLDLTENLNPLIGTSWTAPDVIGEILHGADATTTVEFLTETECQVIDVRPNSTFNKTVVTAGTYTYSDDTVTWTKGDRTITGTRAGSVITVPFGEDFMVYRKD